MTETSSGVKEVDVTACSNEAVLLAVSICARAVCAIHSALDLYNHLKSLEVHSVIVSQQSELINFAFACSPKSLEHQEVMSSSELAAAFLDPARIEAWLRNGASLLGLTVQVGALMAPCAPRVVNQESAGGCARIPLPQFGHAREVC